MDRRMQDPDPKVIDRLVGLPIATVERHLILATLQIEGGNRTRTACVLGIALRTLRNKINGYLSDGHAVLEPQSDSNRPRAR